MDGKLTLLRCTPLSNTGATSLSSIQEAEDILRYTTIKAMHDLIDVYSPKVTLAYNGDTYLLLESIDLLPSGIDAEEVYRLQVIMRELLEVELHYYLTRCTDSIYVNIQVSYISRDTISVHIGEYYSA